MRTGRYCKMFIRFGRISIEGNPGLQRGNLPDVLLDFNRIKIKKNDKQTATTRKWLLKKKWKKKKSPLHILL